MPVRNSSSENQSENSMSFSSFVNIDNEAIKKQIQAVESLSEKVKASSCKEALKSLILFLSGKDTTNPDPNEIYKKCMESLREESELDRSLVYEALGFDAELDNAPDLEDLIKGQIAGFNQKKLLEMCTLSKIAYGDVDGKLKKDKYKTKRQFEEAGYQIIKFYDNELIQDKYCPDSGYELEQHNVGYALTGSNSCIRDAGYIFIKDEEVTIAYHGTRDLNDIKEDLRASLTKLSFLPRDNYVHSGFYSLFKRSWPSVHKILQGYANDKGLEGIKNLKINVTGHSMGGALATIAALCLNKTENAKDINVATFGSPRVFYNDAAEIYNDCLGKKTIRVACQSDPVPCLPHGNAGMHYKHVGKPLKLETDKTLEYLQPYYHKTDAYYDLIQKVQQENFKSDNNASKYRHIAYGFSPLYYLVNYLLGCTDDEKIDNKEFFEEVREENTGVKLPEIPIKYPHELTREKSQLREECETTKTQLTKKEKELDIAKQNVSQLEQEKLKQQASIEELKNTQTQLEQERESVKQELGETIEELKRKEADLENNKKELGNVNAEVSKLEQEKLKQQASIENLVNITQEKSQLEEKLNSVKQELEKAESKNKELGDANQKVARLEHERDGIKRELVEKTNQVTQLKEKLEKAEAELARNNETLEHIQTELKVKKEKFANKEKELESKTKEVAGLTKEKNSLTSQVGELKKANAELKEKASQVEENSQLKEKLNSEVNELREESNRTKAQLKEKEGEVSKLNDQVTQFTNEKSQLREELNTIKAQFMEEEKALNVANEKISQSQKELKDMEVLLRQEQESANEKLTQEQQKTSHLNGQVDQLTEELKGTKAQLEGNGRELDGAKKSVLRLTNDLRQEKSNQQITVNNLNSEITQLTNEKSQLVEKLNGVQQSLKCQDLGNENKKLSAANAQSRKQATYASVSFLLSGALAVGASLIMFHLAICISLAVAASTFLVVGCYCSYKANTALSNVEIENGYTSVEV